MGISKRKMPKELREYATLGDELLSEFAREIASKTAKSEVEQKVIYGTIISNKTLCKFPCYYRLKHSVGYRNYTSERKVGDKQEAWLWFLKENYGREYAYNYLCRQLNKYTNIRI